MPKISCNSSTLSDHNLFRACPIGPHVWCTPEGDVGADGVYHGFCACDVLWGTEHGPDDHADPCGGSYITYTGKWWVPLWVTLGALALVVGLFSCWVLSDRLCRFYCEVRCICCGLCSREHDAKSRRRERHDRWARDASFDSRLSISSDLAEVPDVVRKSSSASFESDGWGDAGTTMYGSPRGTNVCGVCRVRRRMEVGAPPGVHVDTEQSYRLAAMRAAHRRGCCWCPREFSHRELCLAVVVAAMALRAAFCVRMVLYKLDDAVSKFDRNDGDGPVSRMPHVLLPVAYVLVLMEILETVRALDPVGSSVRAYKVSRFLLGVAAAGLVLASCTLEVLYVTVADFSYMDRHDAYEKAFLAFVALVTPLGVGYALRLLRLVRKLRNIGGAKHARINEQLDAAGRYLRSAVTGGLLVAGLVAGINVAESTVVPQELGPRNFADTTSAYNRRMFMTSFSTFWMSMWAGPFVSMHVVSLSHHGPVRAAMARMMGGMWRFVCCCCGLCGGSDRVHASDKAQPLIPSESFGSLHRGSGSRSDRGHGDVPIDDGSGHAEAWASSDDDAFGHAIDREANEAYNDYN